MRLQRIETQVSKRAIRLLPRLVPIKTMHISLQLVAPNRAAPSRMRRVNVATKMALIRSPVDLHRREKVECTGKMAPALSAERNPGAIRTIRAGRQAVLLPVRVSVKKPGMPQNGAAEDGNFSYCFP